VLRDGNTDYCASSNCSTSLFSSMSSITKYYVGFYLRRSSSQVYKCPMFDFSSQRMDFLVSSANISFSVRLAHPTQPAHPAHPAQLAHPAQPVMGIRFHGYLDIRVILRGRYQISRILGYQGYPKRKLIDFMGIRFHGYSDTMDFLGEIRVIETCDFPENVMSWEMCPHR